MKNLYLLFFITSLIFSWIYLISFGALYFNFMIYLQKISAWSMFRGVKYTSCVLNKLKRSETYLMRHIGLWCFYLFHCWRKLMLRATWAYSYEALNFILTFSSPNKRNFFKLFIPYKTYLAYKIFFQNFFILIKKRWLLVLYLDLHSNSLDRKFTDNIFIMTRYWFWRECNLVILFRWYD